jgi:hypothetical protein
MSPTLTTCCVLLNTSPIVLVDSGGHLFARLTEPTMADPGENFVFLHTKKNGAVFAKVKTASCSAAWTNIVLRIVMSTITVVRLVSSLPLYFYTMTSHRDIYIYNC